MTTKNGVTMSPQEQQQFQSMQGDIEQIKRHIATMGTSVDKVYFALMGNEITGKDQSLVGRVGKIEEDMQELKERVEDIATEAHKSKVYLNIVWVACGAVAMAIFTYVLQLIFKK